MNDRSRFDTDDYKAVLALCIVLMKEPRGIVLGELRVRPQVLYQRGEEHLEPLMCGSSFDVAYMAVGILGAREVRNALTKMKQQVTR